VGLTLATVAAAVFLAVALWRLYMVSPWTRDGRVRANVVDIAPEVSGTVVSVSVNDNQFVHKGEALFVIDPIRFRLAIDQAQAIADRALHNMDLRAADARRRANMQGAVSAEEREQYRVEAAIAVADYNSAKAALDVARLNLERSTLYSPVNGNVTNLLLRVGDFATTGQRAVQIVDTDSFWVDGYFEETKLWGIHLGDPARIKLMGYDAILTGHVGSISRGISEPNFDPGNQGLQSINPIFTWVRLAQRIPVRIQIDAVPAGITLVIGLTCSVAVGPDALRTKSVPGRIVDWLEAYL
jgi:RND family efflux transporter MFP subunit